MIAGQKPACIAGWGTTQAGRVGGDTAPGSRIDRAMESGLTFDRVAGLYDEVRPAYPTALIDRALAGRPVRDVLEVGCGTGQLTAELVSRGLHVEAVEPGTNLVAIARRRAPLARISVGRFEDIEPSHPSFDAVFSATAFHWVDPRIGWSKVARLLRPGGRFALLSHVYVTDQESRPAQEALRDIYGAPWRLRTEQEVVEGAVACRDNISAVWAWLENPAIEVPESGELFGDVEFHAVPRQRDVAAVELIDLQRTTSTHLQLEAAERERVEREISELVRTLGGSFPIRQLAVLAVAERRGDEHSRARA